MSDIQFQPEEWVVDRKKPGQPGQYTGLSRKAGPHLMLQIRYPGGGTSYRPSSCLEPMSRSPRSISEQLGSGRFGGINDLRRLVTYEKLKGTLHEVIYSMDAAQIDFYPYQFKPVLKFINSPTERLIIADEVGLGKTIESALIWMELQARRQAKRLLVVCPKILAQKWREELRTKFLLDARTVDFVDLRQEIDDMRELGPSHACTLISTYSGLRPPKSELDLLDEPPGETLDCSPKTALLRELRHWSLGYDVFDMVIFDEAHYMRNPGTATFHLGESLAAGSGAVLCVSATPVNNSNTDLHSLLRLVDVGFFETQGMFEELLEANTPAVQSSNALARTPPDIALLKKSVAGMGKSQFIKRSPLFKQFLEKLEVLDIGDKAQLAKLQDLSEKLNLLGGYINRTRRVQVTEKRPVRVPVVLNVEYGREEKRLYDGILTLVKRKCRSEKSPFHVFRLMGVQLRAASCLPVVAQEIKHGRFGVAEELFDEAFGDDLAEELADLGTEENLNKEAFSEMLNYDFEKNDSKYAKLLEMIGNLSSDEKVLIFAYYRPTLEYLRSRLISDGIGVAVIHGGVPIDQRWEEIDRFRDEKGLRILLSSEVGSEGIDLQFCRVLANYDLPWNPMRVEQRIGRLDRVGQVAKRISIVNFKVRDTIEERLYDRLHLKLERFANSLGDLESVIGTEVKKLTMELLSKKLTLEEEVKVMEQTERVIEDRLLQIQALEESGDALVAFSDYVQKKIEEDKQKGRYILADELEDYLVDFFEREFQGCEVNQNTPSEGCLRINLTHQAHSSLRGFIKDDRTLSARPFMQNKFDITFRREIVRRMSASKRGKLHFLNHLSPLVRWVTDVNQEREHSFYSVSALSIEGCGIAVGNYCYRVERWKLAGLSDKEMLAYGIRNLDSGETITGDQAESIFQTLLRNGKDWDYVDCDLDILASAHSELENELFKVFNSVFQEFEAENTTNHQIKTQRVKTIFDRRIFHDNQRLKTLREAGRDPRLINATKARIQKAMENKERRIRELDERADVEMENAAVAAGVFRVVQGM